MQEKQELSGAGAGIFLPSPVSQIMQLKANKGSYSLTTSLHVTALSQCCEMWRRCQYFLFEKKVQHLNQ